MKRTTIMVDEEVLYDLQRIARSRKQTASNVIREALASYVVDQHTKSPPENPLLALVGLVGEGEPTDMSNGADEEILRKGVHPIYGWGVPLDERDDSGHKLSVRTDEPKRQRTSGVRKPPRHTKRKSASSRRRAP